MNIKEGSIGKIKVLTPSTKKYEQDFFDLEGQIVIVTKVTDKQYFIANKNYACSLNKEDISINSTRISPEVRKGLTDLFKLTQEMQKIQDKIAELNKQASIISNSIAETRKNLVSSDILTSRNIGNISDNYMHTSKSDDKEFTVVFGFEKQVAKYIRPDQMPYIGLEYDNTLRFYDYKKAEKHYAFDLSKYEKNVTAIKEAVNGEKEIKYEGMYDEVYFGDKNSLYVTKCFVFKIKRTLPSSYAKTVFEKIDKEINFLSTKF